MSKQIKISDVAVLQLEKRACFKSQGKESDLDIYDLFYSDVYALKISDYDPKTHESAVFKIFCINPIFLSFAHRNNFNPVDMINLHNCSNKCDKNSVCSYLSFNKKEDEKFL
jgi:hypothetical protein